LEATPAKAAIKIAVKSQSKGPQSYAYIESVRLIANVKSEKTATLKKLRILVSHATSIGWLKSDPSVGIKQPKTSEIRAWTDVPRWTRCENQRKSQ
jgi:hypothetical protein